MAISRKYAARPIWPRSMILQLNPHLMPQRASICSNIPTSRSPTPSFGCAPMRPPGFARPRASEWPTRNEWEGASAGALLPPEYRFDLARGLGLSAAAGRLRKAHNAKWAATSDQFSIGKWRAGICATGSSKSPGCNGGSFSGCGSNTYPTGSFPACKSPLGVYDLDGNAAEHMNLPLAEDQMASRGSTKLGVTEMKGSWFIWDTIRAHKHWSRWRAPFWHGTRGHGDQQPPQLSPWISLRKRRPLTSSTATQSGEPETELAPHR